MTKNASGFFALRGVSAAHGGTALSLRNVTKRYGTKTAVSRISLDLEAGSVLALLGPNGAGKTTTVELCEGFLAPDEGEVEVLGLAPSEDRETLLTRIGVMPQGGGAYPGARADEMLRLVAAYSRNPLDQDWLLEVLELTEVARTPYRRLSGGQQQRLSLACALVGRPELVFLDEPSAGLDVEGRELVRDLIGGLRRDGVSVLLTTHLLEEAEELADKVVILNGGRCVASGSPAQLTGSGTDQRLTFRAQPGLPLNTLRSALPSGFLVTEDLPGVYLLTGPVSPDIPAVAASWCASLNVLLTDLHVGRQESLKDVFIRLTHRGAPT